jgi:hypothetical protein
MKPAFGDSVSSFQEMVIARLQNGNISADDLVNGFMAHIPKVEVTSAWCISPTTTRTASGEPSTTAAVAYMH